jgi:hypothetical protein
LQGIESLRDTLTDGEEVFTYGTDPLLWDTDGDGYGIPSLGGPPGTDWEELYIGTDPTVAEPDSDGDGWSDAAETLHGLNPYKTDSDKDGVADYRDTHCPKSGPAWTMALVLDYDQDGVTDAYEREHSSSPCMVDSEFDGLPDNMEHRFGTDPQVGDTDGDGVYDGAEWEHHTDPLDPASH